MLGWASGRFRDPGRGCLVLDSFPLLYSEEYKALRRPRRHELTKGGIEARGLDQVEMIVLKIVNRREDPPQPPEPPEDDGPQLRVVK